MLRPNCFARTRTGYMPGIVRGRDENDMIVVSTMDGKRRYTFAEEDVWSVEDAWRRIREARVYRVLSSYEFETILDAPRVVRCYDPGHPRRSNYILAEGKLGWTCTCPDYARQGAHCKHIEAQLELDRLELGMLEAPGSPTETATELRLAA